MPKRVQQVEKRTETFLLVFRIAIGSRMIGLRGVHITFEDCILCLLTVNRYFASFLRITPANHPDSLVRKSVMQMTRRILLRECGCCRICCERELESGVTGFGDVWVGTSILRKKILGFLEQRFTREVSGICSACLPQRFSQTCFILGV